MSPDKQDEPIFSNDAHRPIILLVEDEVLVRFDFAEFLRSMDYTVLEAASADEARTVFGGVDHIDLIFSDINMPGSQDGVQLASWVGENFPRVPIILTSGIRPSLEAARLTCPNIIAVVDKPYENESVERLISSALELRAAK